jgi:cupin fold WbuC family metalloprotein
VEILTGDVVQATRRSVSELRPRAERAPLRRARLCAHGSVEDPLHEMLIVVDQDSYIRPHRHPGKTESMHVIEGVADLVIFDDDGTIADVVPIGDYASDRVFYYRMNAPLFHSLRVRSDKLTVHETTNGPFNPSETEFAPWAAEPEDTEACRRYVEALDRELAARNSG